MNPIFCALLFSLVAGLVLAEKSDYCLSEIVKSDERIRSHGYPTETHEVTTQDGYVLTLFRIPYSHKLKNQNEKRPPILLQHGLFSNSDCWLSSGPDNSLAYLLADAGYDVWLGNARGNIYSRNNIIISLNSHKFWHFDWHEIGTIDIPAMIDYILSTTNEEALHFVCHSQGCTTLLVLLSMKPEYNRMIKTANMMAPAVFMKHARNKLMKMFGNIIMSMKDSSFFGPLDAIRFLLSVFCKCSKFKKLCAFMFILASEEPTSYMNNVSHNVFQLPNCTLINIFRPPYH